VLYELHVGTFTREGTFDAATRRLDHLVDLGVTHVELMPVAQFPGRWGWGYDGVDLFAPHQAYGGAEGLKRLVDACHAQGLTVLLDVVYNHLGPSGNYLGAYGPYFTDRYRTPWGDALNLDGPHSDRVRGFLIDNALGWLEEYHLDGLRLDAVHAIVDTSAEHFLEELADAIRTLEARLGKRLVVTAESDLNDPRLIRAPVVGGYGLDAMWSDDIHHALHTVLTGERTGYYADFGSIAQLAKALTLGIVYDGVYSHCRHRRHGRSIAGARGSELIAFIQNHDQVGNRARGDRLSHLVPTDRLKLGAGLLLTAPFVPLLFQGEEWGSSSRFPYFTDHSEPELAQAVRDGRLREFSAFGFRPEDLLDPQASSTFEQAKLDFGEIERAPHTEIFAWYKALLALRRSVQDLSDDRLKRSSARFDENEGWLVVQRGECLIAANLCNSPVRINLASGTRILAMASPAPPSTDGDAVVLAPWSIGIWVPAT
jgi:maltooligosyltrehalose trehalohydrolase